MTTCCFSLFCTALNRILLDLKLSVRQIKFKCHGALAVCFYVLLTMQQFEEYFSLFFWLKLFLKEIINQWKKKKKYQLKWSEGKNTTRCNMFLLSRSIDPLCVGTGPNEPWGWWSCLLLCVIIMNALQCHELHADRRTHFPIWSSTHPSPRLSGDKKCIFGTKEDGYQRGCLLRSLQL